MASSRQRVDRQGQLAAAPGRQRRSLDADDVAEVEVDEKLEGLGAEQVLAGVELDLPAAVAKVEEGGLAVAAAGDDAAGDAVPDSVSIPGASPSWAARTSAMSSRSANSCGKGSIPASRSRSSFARRSARTSESFCSSGSLTAREPIDRQAVSILVIFSFFFGPRGTSTLTTSLRLRPIRALPIGDSLESFCSSGLASVEPTIWNFCESPVFWSLTWTTEPNVDLVGADVLLVDHRGAAQPLLELGDPLLEQRLLVLGVVVLGVLGDVAELARLLDPRRDLAPFRGREVLDLLFELLEPFRGDYGLATHLS